jgi:hypothetical protein
MDCFVARAPRNDDVAAPCATRAKQHIAETARRAIRAYASCENCPSCHCAAGGRYCSIPQISSILRAVPPRQEGRTRRHERGAGCGGRECGARRATLLADGGAVWSWRPDAGAKFLRSKLLRDDGGKRARSPGRGRRKPLKPSRREGRVISATPVVTTLCFLPMHRGRGCGEHPAFPAPSVLSRVVHTTTRVHLRRGNAESCSLVSLAPPLAGRGRGEGLSPRVRCGERAPHPNFAAANFDLSPQAAGRGDFKRFALLPGDDV